MPEAKIRDYERDEVVGRVSEGGIESDDDFFSEVVEETFDGEVASVVYPGDESGEYQIVEVGLGDEGYVREVVDELPSPFDIDDVEKLDELPVFTPGET